VRWAHDGNSIDRILEQLTVPIQADVAVRFIHLEFFGQRLNLIREIVMQRNNFCGGMLSEQPSNEPTAAPAPDDSQSQTGVGLTSPHRRRVHNSQPGYSGCGRLDEVAPIDLWVLFHSLSPPCE